MGTAVAPLNAQAVDAYINRVSSLSTINAQLLPAGSPVQQSIFSTASSIAAWQRHLSSISAAQRTQFLQHAGGHVEDYVRRVEDVARNHRKASRTSKINDLLQPLFRPVGNYIPVAAAASQADPYPSSIVVGGIMCVVQISNNFSEFQELLAKWLAKMSSKITILMHYDLCIYHYDPAVQLALVEVYGDILELCQRALNLYEDENQRKRSGARIFGESLKKRFSDKFGDIITRFELHLDDYEGKAKLCDTKRALDSFRLQVQEAIQQQQFREESRVHWHDSRQTLAQLQQTQALEINSQQRHRDETKGNWAFSRRAIEDSYGFQADMRQSAGAMIGTMTKTMDATKADADRRRVEEENIRLEAERQRLKQKRKEVLDWITTVEFNDVHDRRRRQCQSGTGLWLERHETYEKWISSDKSELLLVTGKPGCGKSILSALVWEQLRLQADTDIAFARFYCRDSDADRNKSWSIWSAILKQLCNSTSELDKDLERLFDTRGEVEKRGPSTTEIIARLPNITLAFSRTFILVDGLDECEDPKDFLEEIEKLIQNGFHNTKVLIFSRPELLSSAHGDTLQIRADRGSNTEDIRTFINHTFSQKEYEFHDEPDTLEQVKSFLLSKAEGSFLYVGLQASSLKGPIDPDPEQILDLLNSLPSDLDEAYGTLLRRMVRNESKYQRDLALNILIWVANSARPLSRKELLEGLAIKPSFTSHKQLRPFKTDRHFIRICADLIDVDEDGNYCLLHSSLKDYLKKLEENCPSELEIVRSKQRQCHDILSTACLTYLLLEELDRGPAQSVEELQNLQHDFPFFSYAVVNWGHHVHQSSEGYPSETAWQLLDREAFRCLSEQCFPGGNSNGNFPYSKTPTTLHIVSLFNLVELAEQRKTVREERVADDGLGYTPLDYALIAKNLDICRWLLDPQEIDLADKRFGESGYFSAYSVAIQYNWNDIVDLLVLNGFDTNLRSKLLNQTPVIKASFEGNFGAVDRLIQANADCDAQDEEGGTALMYAARNSDLKSLGLLLAADAKINLQDKSGCSALHYAARNANNEMIKLLLDKGADTNLSAYGEHDFQLAIHFAASADAAEIIKILHAGGASVDAVCGSGKTPLFYAANTNSLNAAKTLQSLGACFDSFASEVGLIHAASRWADVDFIKFILEHNPKALYETSPSSGKTALHYAARQGNTELCQYLIEKGVNVDAQSTDGWESTALMGAIANENLNTVKYLLEAGSNPNYSNCYELSALHYAADFGYKGMIESLLAFGALPNSRTEDGDTALVRAARRGHHEFVEELFNRVDSLNLVVEHEHETTALHVAANEGFPETVKVLLSNGMCNERDADLNYPIHLGVWSGQEEVVRLLLPHSDLNSKGYYGRTPLQCAATVGHHSITTLLLDEGVGLEITDDDGDTPLTSAIRMGHLDVASSLLEAGANLPSQNSRLKCALLCFAAFEGNEKLISRLHDRGLDMNFSNHHDNPPLTFAAEDGREDSVRILLKYGANPNAALSFLETTPLTAAATFNYSHKVISLLIEAGAVVNMHLSHSKATALTLAATYGRISIVKTLMNANADPLHRDAFGKCAIDYASAYPMVLAAIGSTAFSYTPLFEFQRMIYLLQTILSCSDHILELQDLQEPSDNTYRARYLEIMCSSLLYLDEGAAVADAKLVFLEFLFRQSSFRVNADCDICYKHINDSGGLKCTCCTNTYLCINCYEEYFLGTATTSKSSPEHFRELASLEERLEPLREALNPILQCGSKNDLKAIDLHAEKLMRYKQLSDIFKEYKRWDDEHGSRYGERERPGWQLLKFIEDLIENHGQQSDTNTILDDLEKFCTNSGREIKAYLREYGHSRSPLPFRCSGHKYLRCTTDEYIEMKDDPTVFNDSCRLKDEWVSKLKTKYSNRLKTHLRLNAIFRIILLIAKTQKHQHAQHTAPWLDTVGEDESEEILGPTQSSPKTRNSTDCLPLLRSLLNCFENFALNETI